MRDHWSGHQFMLLAGVVGFVRKTVYNMLDYVMNWLAGTADLQNDGQFMQWVDQWMLDDMWHNEQWVDVALQHDSFHCIQSLALPFPFEDAISKAFVGQALDENDVDVYGLEW